VIGIRITAADVDELQLALYRLRQAFTDVRAGQPRPDPERPGMWLLTATAQF
jgi:hypothetical protein